MYKHLVATVVQITSQNTVNKVIDEYKCDLQTTTMFNQIQADDTSVKHSGPTSVIYNVSEITAENMINIQYNPSRENQLIRLNL